MTSELVQILCVFIATVAFSITFCVPVRQSIITGVIGLITWAAFLLFKSFTYSSIATFVSSMIAIFLSRIMAVTNKCPSTVFIVGCFLPLAPGSDVYWMVYYIITNELNKSLQKGYDAIITVLAIILGIVFMFEIPQKFFNSFGKLFVRSTK